MGYVTVQRQTGGVTAELCQWVTNLDVPQIPLKILTRAKYLVLDGIACGLVGARVPWSEKYVEATRGFEPAGDYNVIGYKDVRKSKTL